MLSLDQVYALVDLMTARWKAFLLLKTFASLRWGEITALTRDDLDLARRTVRVRRQFLTVPGGLQTGPPGMVAELRMVSFPAGILSELQHHLDTTPPTAVTVWCSSMSTANRGGAETSIRTVGWRQACEQIGVPGLHLHDLRHTGNTLAAQSNLTVSAT